MERYGIIGKRLGHSFSPAYFREKFNKSGISAEYLPFELNDVSEIAELIKNNPGLLGLNVTIPFKQSVVERHSKS